MASPNLNEITTVALRNRSGKFADNMTRNNAIMMQLSKSGRIKPFDGGRTILQELQYANNATYRRYSGYEALNIAPSDVFTAAEFPIRQAAVAISISGLEMLQNSGKEAIIDLLESRIENAMNTFENGLAYDLYSDGTQTGQIGGLQSLISTTPTVGTIGGIDRSLWSFWRNIAFSAVTNGGVAMSAANIQDYMFRTGRSLIAGRRSPTLILADGNSYGFFLSSLQAIQRITSPAMADAGFASIEYAGLGKSIPVVLDGGFQGSTGDGNTFGTGGIGAVGGAPATTMYFLNTDHIFYRPHKDRNIVPLDPKRFSVNQDAMVQLVGWAGNLTTSNLFMQGVLTA